MKNENKICIDCKQSFYDRKGTNTVCRICRDQKRPHEGKECLSDTDFDLRIRAKNLEKKPRPCLGNNCTNMVNTDRCHRFCKGCQRIRNRKNEEGMPRGRVATWKNNKKNKINFDNYYAPND